jgi:hypothetical protein
MNVTFLSSFGFHTKDKLNEFVTKKNYNILNVTNILGYVPIVGPWLGVARIGLSIYSYSLNKSGKYTYFDLSQLSRGLIELTSINILLIIADIAATASRYSPELTGRVAKT